MLPWPNSTHGCNKFMRHLIGVVAFLAAVQGATGFVAGIPQLFSKVTSHVGPSGASKPQAARVWGWGPTMQVVMSPVTDSVPKSDVLKERKVLVAGATGRVGSLVVQEILLRYPSWKVVAVVRDVQRAEEVLGDVLLRNKNRVEVTICNLEKAKEVNTVVRGVDQVIWCASGFSGRSSGRFPRLSFLLRVVRFGLWKSLGRVLDLRGPMRVARALRDDSSMVISKPDGGLAFRTLREDAARNRQIGDLPRLVMLSSAAVTRPTWTEAQRLQNPESVDIPIVKANPLGLLNVKLHGEDKMKNMGIPYTIVRSCGINSTFPDGHIEISHGDTAVGRISPRDLARVLVTMLDCTDSTYKTFEVYTKAKSGFFDVKGVKGECEKQLKDVPHDQSIKSGGLFNFFGSLGSRKAR